MPTIILTTIGAAAAATLVILIACLIAPLVGAFTGAVFAFFFPETAHAVLIALKIPGIEFWQLSAAVAFLGGFFRATVRASAS